MGGVEDDAAEIMSDDSEYGEHGDSSPSIGDKIVPLGSSEANFPDP